MEPKPRGWAGDFGSWFDEPGVAGAYDLRPAYPEELFERLASLAAGGAVLDAGCGTGELARRLAPLVARVDAVDASARMIERARRLPGGGDVRWIAAPIEQAEVEPPYDLIVAGDSIHWFDWPVAFPRFATWTAPSGLLAVLRRSWFRVPEARERLAPLYARWSANRDFERLDPVAELERRGLFERRGAFEAASEPWRPTIDEAVAQHHSMNGFVAARMGPANAAAFDRELRGELERLVADGTVAQGPDGRLELDVAASAVYGRAAVAQ